MSSAYKTHHASVSLDVVRLDQMHVTGSYTIFSHCYFFLKPKAKASTARPPLQEPTIDLDELVSPSESEKEEDEWRPEKKEKSRRGSKKSKMTGVRIAWGRGEPLVYKTDNYILSHGSSWRVSGSLPVVWLSSQRLPFISRYSNDRRIVYCYKYYFISFWVLNLSVD